MLSPYKSLRRLVPGRRRSLSLRGNQRQDERTRAKSVPGQIQTGHREEFLHRKGNGLPREVEGRGV